MDIAAIKKQFRTVDVANYPELKNYCAEEIYEGKMGPGGLYLAALMSRELDLKAGMRVLDLGCGRGTTSVFLAQHFDVQVFAVDLWISASALMEKIGVHQMTEKVVPLNLDVTEKLPFATGYFDAIFCMDSIHYYGGCVPFWDHLLPHLKPGGRLCIGSPCFSGEFSQEALGNLPKPYDDGTDLWPTEFSKYHSPTWWASLLKAVPSLENIKSSELEDGIVFWEDDWLFNLAHDGDEKTALVDAAQYTCREEHMPYLTHFLLSAQKKLQ